MISPKKKDELDVFFDISLDLLCIANQSGYFVRVNPAFERVLGYTTEELMAKPFLEFVHPEDLNATKEVLATLELKKVLRDFTNRYQCKDGTYRWLEWRASHSGSLIYAAARDITEKVMTEKDLKERLGFETLLAELSRHFVNVTSEQVDLEINEAMQKICEHLGLDISAMWQWTEDYPPSIVLTHLYRPMPGPPVPEKMIAKDFFPWCLEQLAAGKVIAISTDDVPDEASRDKEIWNHYGIKSSLTLPLSAGGKLFFGALSFNTVREKRSWPKMLVERLQLVAEIFANALIRKLSDRALRESEERLSLASDSAGVGVWILDLSTLHFWTTAKALELFDLPSDHSLTFDYFINLVYHEDRELILRALNQASHSNEDVLIEYRTVKADNSIRWLASRGRRQLSSSGGVERLLGVTMDITERKQAEEATAEVQAMISSLVESTEDLIWSVDPERFGLLTFNSALRDYFMRGLGLKITVGMSPEDMVRGVFTPKVAAKWRQFYLRALREGRFTEEYTTSSGKRILLLSFNLLKRSGEIFGISVFGKDITEQKRAETEAMAARRELWRTDRLLHMGELTASLAHELNQPLTSILSNARAAIRFIKSDKIDMNELTEILEDIARDDKRAGDIIRSLRSMLRPEESEQELIEMNGLLGDAIALFNSEAIIRNIGIETRFEDSLPSVKANRVLLQQVVINLLMNAAESMIDMDKKRKIVIETSTVHENRVRVAIRDYGPGIYEQEPDKIFKPFFTTKRSGLGMGLPLAYSILQGVAGHIWAENNPDGGATFYFELPAFRGGRKEEGRRGDK